MQKCRRGRDGTSKERSRGSQGTARRAIELPGHSRAKAGPLRQSLLLRRVYVEDFLADCGKDIRVAAARRPLVQENLGSHRKALAGDVLLTRQFAELPAEVRVLRRA